MQADAHPDASPIGPRVRLEGPLDGDRGVQRPRRLGEGGEELIATRVDFAAARAPSGGPQQPAHVGQKALVSVAEIGQVSGGVLDVSQQQGHSPGRQPALRAQLTVDEADRHEAVALGGLQQARASPISRRIVVERDAVEACQRIPHVRLVVDGQEPSALRVDVCEGAVGQSGARLRA